MGNDEITPTTTGTGKGQPKRLNMFGALADTVQDVTSGASDFIGGAARATANVIGDASNVAAATIGNAAGNAAEFISSAADSAAGTVSNAANNTAKAATAGAKRVHQTFGGEYDEEFVGNVRDKNGNYILPDPIVDTRECKEIDELTARYQKMLEPTTLAKAGKAIEEATPEQVKALASKVGGAAKETLDGLSKQDLIAGALSVAATGFKQLEEYAARSTVSRDYVLQRINSGKQHERISELNEICLLRSYDISRIANNERLHHIGIAFAEGGSTGAAGFAGLAPNLALSMLIYFRAVQSVAMFYGYDVKNNPAELVVASDVFSQSMAPGAKTNPSNDYVGKVLLYAETTTIGGAAKKTWQAMIETGSAGVLITQIRALSNGAARKALEKNGQKTLENKVFSNALAQVGKNLTLKNITMMVPIIGAGFGALFDTAQMNRVLDFADLFYHKRFILEKPDRIRELTGQELSSTEVGG